MNITSTIKLGTAANLILGYNPEAIVETSKRDGLFRPTGKPLKELDISIQPQDTDWSYPEISLHDDVESLLSALSPYRIVNPSDGTEAPILPAGPLLVADKDREKALQSISQQLGVDLTQSDCGYALVQLRRETGQAWHPSSENNVRVHPNPHRIPHEFGVNEPFRQSMIKLRHCTNENGEFNPDHINVKTARSYLKEFETYGTHFVSKVIVGDIIFQVFAFPKTRFERIKKAYENGKNPLKGPEAVSFRYFTTDANKGTYGYVKQYGKILSFSNDPFLKQSLEANEWHESMWAETNSIFAPFCEGSQIPYERLNENSKQHTLIQVELTTLTLFFEINRKRVWTRIFKAAITQKYKGMIPVKFLSYDNTDLIPHLSKGDLPGLLSTISTPTINTYKPTLDITELKFIAKEEVKSFTLYSDLLYCSKEQQVEIPGTDVAIVAQLIDTSKSTQLHTIKLTDTAYDSLKIHCRKCNGALMIRNESVKHMTIVDGLVYILEDGPHGRRIVNVKEDIRVHPDAKILPKFKTSLEFSFAFAEGIIQSVTNKTVREFIRQCLMWYGTLIPEDLDDIELLELRVRALDLAKTATETKARSFVPLLPFTDYEKQVHAILDYVKAINDQMDAIQEQVERRKQKELLIDVAKTLNENIIQSGELLSKSIEASAAQQKDLENYYASIIEQRKNELIQQQAKIDQLEQMVHEQQSAVQTAVENYKQAVKDWQTREWIKFGLDLATNLFDLATAVLIPPKAIGAVKELGLTAQRIKKVLNMLNATHKLYNSGRTSLENIKNSAKTLEGLDEFDTFTNIAWDEMSQQMNMILATGPSDPVVNRYKAALQSAFNILVTRGKSWVSAKSAARDIARDIYIQQQHQAMNQAQSKRLDQLKHVLKPKHIKDLDRNQVDLIGLTGHLAHIQNQMMGILSKAFIMQDQALQYQYLQPATTIESYDFIGFKGALSRQETNKIKAKTLLNRYHSTITTPIHFDIHGVDVNSLCNGNVFKVNLHADKLEFLEYVHLRVLAVTAHIEGIKSTESGNYLVHLAYQGNPFFDRDTNRNVLEFQTPMRERTYEYECGTDKPKYTDEGYSWSEDVNPITPFSTWEISLPKTRINKGIEFKDQTVNIRLTFILKARIKDIPALLKSGEAPTIHLSAAQALKSGTRALPSSQDLVSQLHKQENALNGWDVVFNMSIEQINNTLAEQYEQYKNNDKEFGGKIQVKTKTLVVEGPPKIYSIKTFNLNYGYPKLHFLPNNDQTVELEMEITGGTLIRCIQVEGMDEQCDPPVEIKGQTLKAKVPIMKMKGLVEGENKDKVYSVVLDLAEGSFSANNIEMSDEERLDFNEAVKAYFVSHPVRYIINSLDLSKIATLDDLKPHEFLFKTLITKSGNCVLQLFIQTANRNAYDYSQTFLNNIPEPIPQGYECSLLINQQRWFNSIMPASLNKGDWKIAGKTDENKRWYAEFTQGSVSGTADLSRLNRQGALTSHFSTTFYKASYFLPNGNQVVWPIQGMSIRPSSDGKLRLSFSKQQHQQFIEEYCTQICNITGCSKWRCSKSTLSTDFRVDISAVLPISVLNDGRNQEVKINISNQAVTVTGRTSGGGPCGSDDLQAQINKSLQEQLPGQVAKNLNVDFNPVSVFALKNLLFPSKNYIHLSEIYVPGDLLLLGNFKKE